MRGKVWVLTFLLLCLSDCAHLPWRTPQEDQRTKGEKTIDPLGYPQDQVIVTRQGPGQESRKTEASKENYPFGYKETQGIDSLLSPKVFRVQFFATKYPDEASQVAETVAGMVSENTYIDYRTPYYWVRVGDCETREKAVLLLQKIKQMGYRESWVVEVQRKPRD